MNALGQWIRCWVHILFTFICHHFRRCHWRYSDNSCNTDQEIAVRSEKRPSQEVFNRIKPPTDVMTNHSTLIKLKKRKILYLRWSKKILKRQQHTRHPTSNLLLGTALFGKPGTIRYASASEAGEEVQQKCLESWGCPKPLKRLTGLAWWAGSFSIQMHLLKDEMYETHGISTLEFHMKTISHMMLISCMLASFPLFDFLGLYKQMI